MAANVLHIFRSRLLCHNRQNLTYSLKSYLHTQCPIYAAPKATKASKKGAAAGVKKKQLEVETDAKILCSRLCGGNIYKDGEDPVLKPDNEYPDWLWNLHTDRKALSLEDLSEGDPKYWRKLKTLTIRQNNKLRKAKNI